jgi:hypothetical protein
LQVCSKKKEKNGVDFQRKEKNCWCEICDLIKKKNSFYFFSLKKKERYFLFEEQQKVFVKSNIVSKISF